MTAGISKIAESGCGGARERHALFGVATIKKEADKKRRRKVSDRNARTLRDVRAQALGILKP